MHLFAVLRAVAAPVEERPQQPEGQGGKVARLAVSSSSHVRTQAASIRDKGSSSSGRSMPGCVVSPSPFLRPLVRFSPPPCSCPRG
jgi:hypothetical protein